MSFLDKLLKRSQLLDEQFTGYLREKYGVDPAESGKWRLAYGSTTLASRKVKLFRVYDPARLSDPAKLMAYDALANSSDAVMFEGQLSKNGDVGQFRDMRQQAQQA